MKKEKNILIYNYDYSRLGLTLEGEFFISSIFTLQTGMKAKSKHDFLIQYTESSVYSYSQLKILVKNMLISFFGITNQRNFKWKMINGC